MSNSYELVEKYYGHKIINNYEKMPDNNGKYAEKFRKYSKKYEKVCEKLSEQKKADDDLAKRAKDNGNTMSQQIKEDYKSSKSSDIW